MQIQRPAGLDLALEAPYEYLRKNPGKEIRSQFIEAFNMWLKLDEASLSIIKEVVEMLHTASLMIDDVEDGSSLRRGLPTAHKMFGTPLTLNAANMKYFHALRRVVQLAAPTETVVKIFAEELIQLHEGQGLEIYYRDSPEAGTPSESDYFYSICNKTGGLFRLATRLMLCATGVAGFRDQPESICSLANLLGIHFQLCDDYQNLVSDAWEDMTEGKYTLPLIHAINTGKQSELSRILAMRSADPAVRKYAKTLLADAGSIAYVQKRISEIGRRIDELMQQLPANPVLGSLWTRLCARSAAPPSKAGQA